METTSLTIPLPPSLFWGFASLACIALASWIVFSILPGQQRDLPFLNYLRERLGIRRMPVWSFILGAVLWVGIVTVLTAGLFGLIIDVLSDAVPRRDVSDDVWEFRFKLVQLTALTTVLGAAIALPLTMARLRLTRRTNKTAEEALFNDKINEATKGLYARRQVSKQIANGTYDDHWHDDIVQRNAAINRLEGLAQEKPTEVPRIARLLSVYVRELSAEVYVQAPPFDAEPEALWAWVNALPKLRSDMEKAAQTLGGLADIAPDPLANGEIDLSGANLQAAALRRAKLNNAVLKDAQLPGGQPVRGAVAGDRPPRGAVAAGRPPRGAVAGGRPQLGTAAEGRPPLGTVAAGKPRRGAVAGGRPELGGV